MAYDGSVIIDTKLSNEGLKRGLRSAESDIINFSNKWNIAKKAIDETTAKVTELQIELERLKADEAVQRDILGIEGYDNKVRELTDAIVSGKAEIDKNKQSIIEFNEAAISASDRAKFFGEEIRKLGDNSKSASALLYKIGRYIKDIAKNSMSAKRNVNGIGKGIQNITKQFNRFLLRALLFRAIANQIRLFTQYLSAGLRTNVEFTNSLAQLKGAALTAFQPIYEFIVPALTTLINYLTIAIQYLAAFFSMLAGKSVSEMKANAKALWENVNAIEGAGAAAKEANKHLLPFDELIVLSDTATGSGAGRTQPIIPDFDWEVPDTSWLDKFINKLKNIHLEIDMDYWSGLGAILAENIANGLNKINWTDIKKRAENVASNIAGFINGFLASGNGRQMLENVSLTIANGINTGLTFVNTLLEEIKFREIGQNIGHSINNFVKDFDWKLLGETISNGINGALDFLIGLLETINWGMIGEKITDLIFAFDWNGMIKKLGEVILRSMTTIFDFTGGFWSGLFINIGRTLGFKMDNSAQEGIRGFFNGLYKVALEIFQWIFMFPYKLSEYLQKGIASFGISLANNGGSISETIKNGIMQKWSDIYNWINEKIVKPFIFAFKDLFGISSPSTVMADIGKYIVEGLWKGISDKTTWLINQIQGFARNITSKLKSFFGISSPSKVFRDEIGIFLGAGIALGLEQSEDKIVNVLENITDAILDIFEDDYNLGFGVTPPNIPALSSGGIINSAMISAMSATSSAKKSELSVPFQQLQAEQSRTNALLEQLIQVMLDKNLTVELDGQTIGTSVESWQNQRGFMTGGMTFANAY